MLKLNEIELINYKKDEHKEIKEELLKGKSHSHFIKQIDDRLIDEETDSFSLDSAYLVKMLDKVVGYVFISDIKKYKVYVEYNVLYNYRNKGIGKIILSEITDFLLENYPIKEIALDIDVSNLASINLAESCGYYMEEEFNKNRATNSKEFTYVNPYFNNKKNTK